MVDDGLNSLATKMLDAAFKVHRILGPGLLESAYRTCLVHELRRNGISAETEVPVAVVYEGVRLDAGYRIDILVEGQIVIELKVVESLLPIHRAQLLSYLRLSNKRLGYLMNFHSVLLKDGIQRMVND